MINYKKLNIVMALQNQGFLILLKMNNDIYELLLVEFRSIIIYHHLISIRL